MARLDSRFPKQTKFIIGNEACERFSFYGLKSILAGYMTSQLMMGEDESTSFIHLFVAINYLLPLAGGWISDRFWGRYKTILWISLLYCVGHGILATSDLATTLEGRKWILMSGLMVIAFGSGGIKPCVSSFMGDQFLEDKKHLLKKAYASFYWAINFGSFFAFLVIPWLKDTQGWSWAFGVPGIAMGLATLIFWLGRARYVRVEPSGAKGGRGFFSIWFHCLTSRRKGEGFWHAAEGYCSQEELENAQSVIRILKIFILVPPFFALFEQTASTWVMQGMRMETILLDFGFFQWEVQAAQLQAANPVFVMLLIPLLTGVVYNRVAWLDNPLHRMTCGMFLSGVAYGVVAWLQWTLDGGVTLSLAWQLLPYLILTTAEVLVSTTGLEFAFTQAPARMKSTITSFWNMTIFAGNLLVAAVTWLLATEGGHSSEAISGGRFLSYGIMTACVALVFMWMASRYRQKVS